MKILKIIFILNVFISPAFSQTGSISVGPSHQTVACNSIVDIPIRASRFSKMLSMQGTIQWDTAVLRFDSIAHYGPPSLSLQSAQFGLSQTGMGKLFFSWNDPTLQGVSLPDSSTLYTLRFSVRVTSPTTTKVMAGGDVVPLEFVDTSYNAVSIQGDTGIINLSFKVPGFDPFPDTIRICGTSTSLDAGTGFNQYTWSNGNVGSVARITDNGYYTVNVKNALGCTGQDGTYLSLVTGDIIQPDTTVCKGARLSLQARSGLGWTYEWTPSGTGSSLISTVLTDTLIRLKVTDGITSCRDSVRILVATVDTSLSVTGSLTFCASRDSTVFMAGNGASYQWLRDGRPLPGAMSIRYVADSSGTYRVIIRNSLGCSDSSRSVLVTVNPLPRTILINPGDSLLCEAGTRLLLATGADSYRWYRNDTLLQSPVIDTIILDRPGRYVVEGVSSAGCSRRADTSFTLTLVSRPRIAFDIAGVCVDVPIRFTNRSMNIPAAGVGWRWSFGNGLSDTSTSPQTIYRDTGRYRVLLRYQNSRCPVHQDSLYQTLQVIRAANVRFTDVIAVRDIGKVLMARDTAVSWSWNPAMGLSLTSVQNPSATLRQAQTYVIRSTLKNGCIVYDSLLVKVANETNIHVPKGFSPNGDRRNDLLYPILVGIEKLNYFRVYNRWGNLVYELRSMQTNMGWDGRYKGVAQPMEGYVWVAEGVDVLGKTIRTKGSTLLIR
jgi:gliding motility-associated-like protein